MPRNDACIPKYECVACSGLSLSLSLSLTHTHTHTQSGGEMYFSDIYADKDLPPEVRRDKILYGKLLIFGARSFLAN